MGEAAKQCTKCFDWFPATLEYFYKKSGAGILHPQCKSCLLRIQKEYRQTIKGRAVQKRANKKYRQTSKGKAITRGIKKRYYEKYATTIIQGRKDYYSTVKGKLRLIFNNMFARCNKSCHPSYKNYGRRGIKVCFTSDEFVSYVMDEMQVDPRGLQIDRIDNGGNYERGNIRFVTHKENQQNKRELCHA